MPGPGPGSCLRRGGGGGRAGCSAPSLTLRAPASCSISPSRLLLHLLLTARGGRQGAGAPGPARTPRLRPERLAPPHHRLGRQDQRAEPRRGDTGPGEEAGGRNAATYGDCPPRRAPLPRFPLLQPDPGLLRATGARRPEGRGLARLRAGSQAGASRGGGAASPVCRVARARGVSAAPRKRRPRSSLASEHWSPDIYPPRVLHSGTLLGRPSSWGKEGATSILFPREGSCLRSQACLQSPKLPSPLTGRGFSCLLVQALPSRLCALGQVIFPLWAYLL